AINVWIYYEWKVRNWEKINDKFYTPDVIISLGYHIKSKQLQLDVEKYNSQYSPITLKPLLIATIAF
ncbi:hypothetical protein, partial [Streptomyces niveiscabiei]|uniref:hypothetical protein n=1 Tax=Streptomyces niveiscabiei TaxID=164115 RepID=UPI0038F770D6